MLSTLLCLNLLLKTSVLTWCAYQISKCMPTCAPKVINQKRNAFFFQLHSAMCTSSFNCSRGRSPYLTWGVGKVYLHSSSNSCCCCCSSTDRATVTQQQQWAVWLLQVQWSCCCQGALCHHCGVAWDLLPIESLFNTNWCCYSNSSDAQLHIKICCLWLMSTTDLQKRYDQDNPPISSTKCLLM